MWTSGFHLQYHKEENTVIKIHPYPPKVLSQIYLDCFNPDFLNLQTQACLQIFPLSTQVQDAMAVSSPTAPGIGTAPSQDPIYKTAQDTQSALGHYTTVTTTLRCLCSAGCKLLTIQSPTQPYNNQS